MKALVYVKIQIKSLMSDIKVSVLYFIGLPLIIGFAMNYFNDKMIHSDFKIDPINIRIEDNDQSMQSSNLISYLNTKELESVLNTKNNDYDVIIEIPKGYGEDILAFNDNTIKVKDNNTKTQNLDMVKSILDGYHFSVYKELRNEEFESNIEIVKLESKQVKNTFSFYAVSLISFVLGMIVLSLTRLDTEKAQKVKDERVKTTPITEWEALNLKCITYFIYSVINVGAYCLVYRISQNAFIGDFSYLIIAITVASLAITSIIIFLLNVIGEKYAKVVAMIIFIIPIVGGGVFLEQKSFIANLSILNYITNIFESFDRTGNLNSSINEVVVILLIAVGLYLITIIKVKRGKIR